MWNNKYLITVMIVIIEFTLIFICLPVEDMERNINQERKMIVEMLGKDSARFVYGFARKNYEELIIDSGIYTSIYHFLIPTEEQKQATKGLEQLGTREGWFGWLATRIDATTNVIYLFLSRIGLIILWAPYILTLLIPSVIAGVLERKIKQSNFDYASPLVARMSHNFLLYGFLGIVMVIFLPLTMPPILIPIILMIVCVVIGLALGNVQKRI